jgi:hypothetical protein
LEKLDNDGVWNVVTIDNVSISSLVLPSASTVTLAVAEDGIYRVTMETDVYGNTVSREFVFLLDCNIKACKKQLLLDYLCDKEDVGCNDHCSIHEKWLKFHTLEQLIYHKWDVWKQQQTTTNLVNVSGFITDVFYVRDLINELLKLCNPCGTDSSCNNCGSSISNDTSCGC